MSKLAHALIAGSLVALSLGACQAQVAGGVTPGSAASPGAPAPGLTPPPGVSTASSLTGDWMTGGAEDAEPAGPYMSRLECPEGGNGLRRPTIPRDVRHRTWRITHQGDDVAVASHVDDDYGPTGPRPHCPKRATAAKGTYRDGKLTLTGTLGQDVDSCESYGVASPWPIPASTSEALTFELQYDATSGHLRGTRNGEPFWAAPVQDPAPDPVPCGPQPVA